MKKIITIFLAVVCLAFSANAQVKDKEFKDWTVYTTDVMGSKTCYIASFPTSQTGNYTRRDEPYFLVTRISNDVVQISTSSGYPYKNGSNVEVNVDKEKVFKLITEPAKGAEKKNRELAWATDVKSDKAILAAMKKGLSMVVKGTSTKGTYSVDKYSLRGISDALDRMNKVCGG